MANFKKTKLVFKTENCLMQVKKCKMLQVEHSAILSTFIKLLFVIKIFVLSIFERPFYTAFTVHYITLTITLACGSSTVGSMYKTSRGIPPCLSFFTETPLYTSKSPYSSYGLSSLTRSPLARPKPIALSERKPQFTLLIS